MHKSVMAVTAICSVVSFLVRGVRDRHLTEATVVLGVVVANRSGDHGTPSKPFSAISKIFANAASSVAQADDASGSNTPS